MKASLSFGRSGHATASANRTRDPDIAKKLDWARHRRKKAAAKTHLTLNVGNRHVSK